MIYNISIHKRLDKNGTHCGGVEKFAMYLKRAVPELKLISWADYPKWLQVKEPDYIKAEILNEYLLSEGILGKDSTVIVDGYWGLGLPGEVERVISVVHGSYFGRLIQSQIYPWGEIVRMDEVEEQLSFWGRDDVDVVCVAKESERELKLAGIDKDLTTIYHGIDLEVFKPISEGTCIMFAATSARKGYDVVNALQNVFKIPLEHMSEFSGVLKREARRLNHAKMLVAPTRHEGNSYLLIEALACGVPLITYATGLALEMDNRCGYIIDDISPSNIARLIDILKEEKLSPREWAEEFCSFERFRLEWRRYLGIEEEQ